MIKLNNKKYIVLLISSIIIVVVAAISITFAYLSYSSTQEGVNTLNTGCYNVNFTDSNIINLVSYPMSSASAFSKLNPYEFTLTNTCSTSSKYQVYLNIINTSNSNLTQYINYSLDKSTTNKLKELTPTTPPEGVSSSNVSATYLLDSGSLPTINSTKTYNLYLWIDESAGNDIMGSTFKAEIVVYNVAG